MHTNARIDPEGSANLFAVRISNKKYRNILAFIGK